MGIFKELSPRDPLPQPNPAQGRELKSPPSGLTQPPGKLQSGVEGTHIHIGFMGFHGFEDRGMAFSRG